MTAATQGDVSKKIPFSLGFRPPPALPRKLADGDSTKWVVVVVVAVAVAGALFLLHKVADGYSTTRELRLIAQIPAAGRAADGGKVVDAVDDVAVVVDTAAAPTGLAARKSWMKVARGHLHR